jgi:two-component system NarL family sensor kinase
MAELKATLAGAEQERVRMAKELHDGVLSRLSAVKLNFATLPGMLQDTVEEPEGFKEALQQLELSILELRTTSHNLYPEILEQEGLVKAFHIFCKEISNIAPVNIDFQSIGDFPSGLPKAFELNLYRMLQELVQNIVKHSGAHAALVQMVVKEDWLNVSIEDNGKGLPADWKKTGIGMGLAQMDKRLKSMYGRMNIDNTRGTNIYLEFNLLKVKNDEPHN